MHKRTLLAALSLAAASFTLHAQEGPLPTQALVRADSKQGTRPTLQTTTVEVDGKNTPLSALTPVTPATAQVVLLIDDGLSRSAGIQLNDLRSFATSLPPATELLVGYMSNGRVLVTSPFTTDHAAAARSIRLPISQPGISASPYFCLSEFVKHWPGAKRSAGFNADVPEDVMNDDMPGKARFVVMLTNGVDPYNGSVSPLNQNSPYVDTAVRDAQRAGAAVYSIYYSDAFMRGGAASFSGQGYLQEVAEGTGGQLFNQGVINPVSIKPFLKQFQKAMLETYVATFDAEGGKRNKLVRLKVSTSQPNLKLRTSSQVRPGNVE